MLSQCQVLQSCTIESGEAAEGIGVHFVRAVSSLNLCLELDEMWFVEVNIYFFSFIFFFYLRYDPV